LLNFDRQLGGVKEQYLPDFASRFNDAGYGVLLYDHRNWGDSEGIPREETNPLQQAIDYSDAFDFVVTLPSVDSGRVVFWGSSMSGGACIYASAFDRRIRASIAQVPFVSGANLDGVVAEQLPAILHERQSVKAGNPPKTFQFFAQSSQSARSPDCPALMNEPGFIPFLEELERRGIAWNGRTTILTLLHLNRFEPMSVIHRISPTPLLMVLSDNDIEASTSEQLKAYALAHEPKQMALLQRSGHFDPYFGPAFEKNIAIQLKFLNEILENGQPC
jgi:fermentation-respiration switch protein FrsA (DUF1100 family)